MIAMLLAGYLTVAAVAFSVQAIAFARARQPVEVTLATALLTGAAWPVYLLILLARAPLRWIARRIESVIG